MSKWYWIKFPEKDKQDCFNIWKQLALTPKRNINYNYKLLSRGAKIKTFIKGKPSQGQHLASRTLKVCPTYPHTLPCTCTHTPSIHTHAHMHTHTCTCTITPTHAYPSMQCTPTLPCTPMHSCLLTPHACTHAHAHTPHMHAQHMHAHPPSHAHRHAPSCTHPPHMHTQLVSKTIRLIGSKPLRKPNELIRKLPDKDSCGQAQQVQICTTGPGKHTKQTETTTWGMGGSSRVAASHHLKQRHKKSQEGRAHTQRENVVSRHCSAVTGKLTRQIL